MQTLDRELFEELGARAQVLYEAFVLEHEKAGKQLQEHFFVCRLLSYDLSLRCGPEFDDPSRGEFIPHPVTISRIALEQLEFKTEELAAWLKANTALLLSLSYQAA